MCPLPEVPGVLYMEVSLYLMPTHQIALSISMVVAPVPILTPGNVEWPQVSRQYLDVNYNLVVTHSSAHHTHSSAHHTQILHEVAIMSDGRIETFHQTIDVQTQVVSL